MPSISGCSLTGDLTGTNIRKQLGITLTKMYWLLGRKSKLSTSNKFLIYKTTVKAVWTYGIKLMGTASTSNTEILECFHTKAFGMIVDEPWYVPSTVIRRELQTPTVKEEIRRYSSPRRTPKRPSSGPQDATRQQEIAKTPAK
jgi:hypothetical protein